MDNFNFESIKFLIPAGVSIICLLAIMIKISVSVRVRRIKVFDIEVEAEKECNKELSILNRFIDELIYFFHISKVQVLVIEDLDRFDDLSIFTKLREINGLINNNETVKQKVSFVYCIKDGLFDKDVDRAKFFEYVISLIPILSFNNVRDHLERFNNDINPEMKLSPDFMNKIKFFVDDYRLLNNTFNDYQLYWETLKFKQADNNEKLFAMMLYKNKCPKDFAMMQQNQGPLVNIFRNKTTVIENINRELEKQIEDLKAEKNELERMYFESFRDYVNLFEHFIWKNKNTSGRNDAVNISELKSFQEKEKIYSIRCDSHSYYGSVMYYGTISEFEKIRGIDCYKIEKQLEYGKNNSIKQIDRNINSISDQIRKLSSMSIQKIIENNIANIDKIIDGNESKILIFLVSNGYIAEDYMNYAVSSSKDTFTLDDRNFISNVLLKKGDNYDLELCYFENILSDLPLEWYEYDYSYNVSLINFIYKNKNKHEDEYNGIMRRLYNNGNVPKQLITKYIIKYGADDFINELVAKYNENIQSILEENEIDDNKKVLLINKILDLCNGENIIEYNSNGTMKNNISMSEVKRFNVVSNAEKLELIDVKFATIDDISIEEIKAVSENNLYEISYDNIKYILENLFQKNCLSSAYKSLNDNEYVSKNIDSFYKCFENEIRDENDIDTIEEILLLDNFSYSKELIENMSLRIRNITKYSDKNLSSIVDNEKYVIDWINLDYAYSKKMKVDFPLLINNNAKILSSESIDNVEFRKEVLKFNIKKEILNAFRTPILLDEKHYIDENVVELTRKKMIEIDDKTILNSYPKTFVAWYEENIDEWDIDNIEYDPSIVEAIYASKLPSRLIKEYVEKFYKEIINNGQSILVFNMCREKKIVLNDGIYIDFLLENKYNFTFVEEVFDAIQNKNELKNDRLIKIIFEEIPNINNHNLECDRIKFGVEGSSDLCTLIRFFKDKQIITCRITENASHVKISGFRIK